MSTPEDSTNLLPPEGVLQPPSGEESLVGQAAMAGAESLPPEQSADADFIRDRMVAASVTDEEGKVRGEFTRKGAEDSDYQIETAEDLYDANTELFADMPTRDFMHVARTGYKLRDRLDAFVLHYDESAAVLKGVDQHLEDEEAPEASLYEDIEDTLTSASDFDELFNPKELEELRARLEKLNPKGFDDVQPSPRQKLEAYRALLTEVNQKAVAGRKAAEADVAAFFERAKSAKSVDDILGDQPDDGQQPEHHASV